MEEMRNQESGRTVFKGLTLDGERALYGISNADVVDCRFDGPADGESALKEASCVTVSGCFMNLRYPFWHLSGSKIADCVLTENCRAALWYDKDVEIEGCRLGGIKALRECDGISIRKCTVDSPEFAWKCRDVVVDDVDILGSEYPFFEIERARMSNLRMKGKYSFQYCRDIEISSSDLDTKDAFWHSKNVTVRDSVVRGEYLGWYSENLRLVNCRIIGTQPFCYCKNLVLENCTMEGCDLSFERSSVVADVSGRIDSVKNPLSGKIRADEIGGLILEKSVVGLSPAEISCPSIAAVSSDIPEAC